MESSIDIQEFVIIVHNYDGDILGVIMPTDPLNPQFEVDELNALGTIAELHPVESFAHFLDKARQALGG